MSGSYIQVIAIIGSNLIIMLTFFGISISLHNAIKEDIRGMQTEMKDFHTKLAIQDLEFKMRLCAIEEKKRG